MIRDLLEKTDKVLSEETFKGATRPIYKDALGYMTRVSLKEAVGVAALPTIDGSMTKDEAVASIHKHRGAPVEVEGKEIGVVGQEIYVRGDVDVGYYPWSSILVGATDQGSVFVLDTRRDLEIEEVNPNELVPNEEGFPKQYEAKERSSWSIEFFTLDTGNIDVGELEQNNAADKIEDGFTSGHLADGVGGWKLNISVDPDKIDTEHIANMIRDGERAGETEVYESIDEKYEPFSGTEEELKDFVKNTPLTIHYPGTTGMIVGVEKDSVFAIENQYGKKNVIAMLDALEDRYKHLLDDAPMVTTYETK